MDSQPLVGFQLPATAGQAATLQSHHHLACTDALHCQHPGTQGQKHGVPIKHHTHPVAVVVVTLLVLWGLLAEQAARYLEAQVKLEFLEGHRSSCRLTLVAAGSPPSCLW